MPMQVNQATEPLYIVKPFSGGGIAGLFSTHPPIEERVRRLRQMRPPSLASAQVLGSRRHLGVRRSSAHPGGDDEPSPRRRAGADRRRQRLELSPRGPRRRPGRARVRLIELERNVGFGAASNAGVAAATGEATVLLNPDTELLDDGLDRLAVESLELGALVGPRVLNPDGTVQPSASGPEVGAWPWVRALVPAAIQPRRPRPHRALPPRAGASRSAG